MTSESSVVSADLLAEISARFHLALTGGDVASAAVLYSEDISIWHNHDRIDRNKTESLAAIAALHAEYDNFRVDNVRLDMLPDGYAERCVFRGMHRLTGVELSVEAMLRVWTDGSRITRIEEYTDSAQGVNPGQT